MTLHATDTGTSTSTVSDANGRFRFEPLAPGRYSLSAELADYRATEVPELAIAIGGRLSIQVPLRPAAEAAGSPAGPPPFPMSTKDELGLDLGRDLIRDLPTGRDAISLAAIAPGVWPDAVGLAVYGSTGAENSSWIDGLETTGLELGLAGTALPPEFLQQLRMTTAGAAAAYGSSTGGTVTMLTRSGGDELHGELFGYWQSDSLRSDAQHWTAPPTGFEWTRQTDAPSAKPSCWRAGPAATASSAVSAVDPLRPASGSRSGPSCGRGRSGSGCSARSDRV